MKEMLKRWKVNFAAMNEDEEGADIVTTLLIILGFVMITSLVLKFLWPVIMGQAKKTSDTIDNTTFN